MALQTKTALASTIATNLADSTSKTITPALHRAVETNLLDGIFSLLITSIDHTDSPYTVNPDVTQVLLANPTEGAITVNLPAVASSASKQIIVKNIGTTNAVTIDGSGSETIDGSETLSLATQYDVARVVCNGSAWWVIGN